MSLRQFLFLSLRGYKTFAFFCACTLLIAFATILLSPKKWDVNCIVSPPVRMAPHLDTSLNLTMRLRAPTTLVKVIGRLKSQEGIDISYGELKNSLRVNTVGDNVEMHIESRSGEIGVKIAQLFIQEANSQEKEFLAILKDSEKSVRKEILDDCNKNYSVIASKLNAGITDNLLPKELEYINENARTYFIVEPNYDQREIWPNKILLISSAIIVGLLLGLIKLFFYDRQGLND